ncbi:single-stranded DNA-binding protein [Burkholderia pyrrocinia]|nr:single-stranded DNA-binding protein [Burkholderia pyrrocinia]
MKGKRRYVLTHDFSYEIVVEIDHDVLTDERLSELVRFWGDCESRIKQHGALTAFLKLFAARFMTESVASSSPKDAFNEGRVEGFPAVDGASGLLVVDYDKFSFEANDIDVLEI